VSTKDYSLTKDGLAAFSSRGPTADGRMKPDICAPGDMTMIYLLSRNPNLTSPVDIDIDSALVRNADSKC
jgi:hypothetical protein